MIWVTMKDGRTIRYNTCRSYTWDNDRRSLVLETTSGGSHIGRINLDLVERVEYTRPCAITKGGKNVKVGY